MPYAPAREWYLVRRQGRGRYTLAHAHDDAQGGAGAACGARLSVDDWALEDAEVSRLRRRVLCARCAARLRAQAAELLTVIR